MSASGGSKRKPRTTAYPVKLDDGYPCRGVDANGRHVTYFDLLREGERVGEPVPGDPLNAFPPFGIVVEREDGLWIEAEPPEVTRRRHEAGS